MSKLQRLGTDSITGYEVCVYGVSTPSELASLRMPSPRFVCLLSMDASAASVDAISTVAMHLLNAGAAYICCWGPDCERVHDLIDEAIVGNGVTPIEWANVMTTWHAQDSIADAVNFFFGLRHPTTPT